MLHNFAEIGKMDGLRQEDIRDYFFTHRRILYHESRRDLMIRKILLGGLLFGAIVGTVCAKSPDISLKDTAGAVKTYDELVSGDRTIVFFWASWCHFCRKELDKLPEYQEYLAKNNITLYAVNIGESLSEVKRYKDTSKFPYPIFLDEEQEFAKSFSIFGIPTFIYFTGGGEVDRNNYFIPAKIDAIFKVKQAPQTKSAEKNAEKNTKKARFK